jgi:hypothetical protein
MTRILPLIAAAAMIAAPAAAARHSDPEAELAEALQGRVAGDPVHCIDIQRVRSSRIIPRTAILYEAGSVIYLQRPRGGAGSLDHWDTLLTRLYTSQLCSTDTVQLVDQQSHMLTGIVFLDDFIPYRRVPRGD